MDLMTIKSQRTKLVCGLLIFAWIAESAAQGDVPKVTLSPEHKQEVEYQKTATFNCTFSGNPTPNISWSFGNKILTSSLKHNINTTGNVSILRVKDLTRTDSGKYECRAINSLGNTSNTSELVVLSPPDSPTDLTLGNITAMSISFRWKEGPFNGNSPVQNFSVETKENGKPYPCPTLPKENGACIYTHPSATFSFLDPFTTYNFTVCSVNSIGKTCTDGAFSVTTLEYAPGIPRNLTAIATSSQNLLISWKEPVVPNGIIRKYNLSLCLQVDGNMGEVNDCGNLTSILLPADMKSFNASDSFTLCAYCGYKITLGAITINLGSLATINGVKTKEDVPGVPKNVILNPISSTELRISWEIPSQQNGVISGYYVTWRIVRNDTDHPVDGELKTMEVGRNSYSFDIEKLEPHSEYIVTVNAVNGAGNGSNVTETARTEEHAPSAPTDVKVVAVSSSQLNITWKPPLDPNGVITGYNITWRMTETDLNTKPEINTFNRIPSLLDASARNYSIDNLKPYSEYNVTVNAVTKGGSGSVEFIVNRTEQSTPGIPRELVATNISSTELNVTWNEPSRRNGILKEYTVYYKLVLDDNNKLVRNAVWKSEQTGLRTVKLYSLEKYSEYEVKVSASTKVGEGENTTAKEFRTAEDEPGVPNNVTLSSVSNSSQLHLTWQKPVDPNGIIRGYVVTWIKVSNDRDEKVNGTLKRQISGEKDTWFLIESLDPYSVYNVGLNAFTSAGNGTVVNRSDRTNESTPGIPRELVATNISTTELTVTWSEPSRRNGILKEYTVYYKLIQYDNNTLVSNAVWKSEQTYLRTVKLSGLEKYSEYEVKVSASTEVGEGENTTAEEFRTSEDVPGPPSRVQCGSLAKKSLNVSWSKPEDPNGVIRSYELSWKKVKNKDAPDEDPGVNSGSDATKKQSFTNIGNGELEPYTEYNVSVAARTLPQLDYGEAFIISCDTAAAVPKAAPTNVRADLLGPHEANVSWKLIHKMNWQDSSINYTVEYNKSGSTPQRTVIAVGSSHSSVKLTDLDFTSNYTVYVFASNSVGHGTKSEKVSFSTNSYIDECKNPSLYSCHSGFDCVNTLSSYECVCNGRIENGKCEDEGYTRYRLNLRLKEEYTNALSNNASQEFKAIETRITNAMAKVYENNDAYYGIEVKKMKNGSVVAEMELIFTDKNKKGISELLEAVRNNSFGDFDVDPNALTVVMTGTCESQQCPGNSTCKQLTADTISCPCNDGYYYDGVSCKEFIVIKVEVALEKEFTEELKNKSSQVYQELERNITAELYETFKDTPNFQEVVVLGFRNGSVIVDFKVVYRKDKNNKKIVVAETVREQIVKTGKLGNYQVKSAIVQGSPPPPAGLKETGKTDNSIDISWEKPKGHSAFVINGYMVRHKIDAETQYKNQYISSTSGVLNAVLTGLESDTIYEITVHAYNNDGNGTKLKIQVTTEKPDDSTTVVIIVVVIVIVLLLIIAMVVFFQLRKRRYRYETRRAAYANRSNEGPMTMGLATMPYKSTNYDNYGQTDEEASTSQKL